MSERKLVLKEQESADLDGITLEQAKIRIESLIKNYGGDAIIDWHQYPYDESTYLYIHQYVLETDGEYAKRLVIEQAAVLRQEARDLAEYERLAKKLNK